MNIRLDLHKTLDTIEDSDELPCPASDCCCISYVKRLTTTRVGARDDIIARIASGQISFGAMVFARGNGRDPDAAKRFTEIGSKAWFNSKLGIPNDRNHIIFMDDSDDHVDSVKFALSKAGQSCNSIEFRHNQKLCRVLQDAIDSQRR